MKHGIVQSRHKKKPAEMVVLLGHQAGLPAGQLIAFIAVLHTRQRNASGWLVGWLAVKTGLRFGVRLPRPRQQQQQQYIRPPSQFGLILQCYSASVCNGRSEDGRVVRRLQYCATEVALGARRYWRLPVGGTEVEADAPAGGTWSTALAYCCTASSQPPHTIMRYSQCFLLSLHWSL